MISTFLLQGAAGCLLAVLPVPPDVTGRAFNRFVAALSGVILALGLAAGMRAAPAAPSRALWGLALLCAAISAGLAHAGRLRAGRFVLQAATAWACVAAALDAGALAVSAQRSSPVEISRFVADALSSAWLLGAVLVAMILGHYYLNIPGLPIRHLIRLAFLAVIASALRGAVFGWGLLADGGAILSPFLAMEVDVGGILPAVVLIQRFLFGIAGTLVLSLMAWRTAKIASIQSATGILYIGVIAVLVGELASRYLLFTTGSPL